MESAVIRFNCATLTASVSSEPAATFVIWRVRTVVPVESPTEIAAAVDFQVGEPSVDAAFVVGSYPAIPLSTEAIDSLPNATPPFRVTFVL